MTQTRWEFEAAALRQGAKWIAGVDEAGRGPLAGPVVAAAVILAPGKIPAGVDDSKKLTPRNRQRLFEEIRDNARAVGVGIVEPPEIDRLNILNAALQAMCLAVEKLSPAADYLLVDGNREILTGLAQLAIVKGDARSLSIAAASIIAKETRDRLMVDYHRIYPAYGFDRHKGYPTIAHRTVLAQIGPCPIHRRSFRGVREYSRHPGS
ncbi:MAG: ribonuclease HII [Desulfobacterales bacterium]